MNKNTIVIEKETFYQMIECLGKFEKYVELLCNSHSVKNVEWLDTQEVCNILNIKPRTLQTYRDTGKIEFVQIEGKIFYQNTAVQKLLNDNRYKNDKL